MEIQRKPAPKVTFKDSTPPTKQPQITDKETKVIVSLPNSTTYTNSPNGKIFTTTTINPPNSTKQLTVMGFAHFMKHLNKPGTTPKQQHHPIQHKPTIYVKLPTSAILNAANKTSPVKFNDSTPPQLHSNTPVRDPKTQEQRNTTSGPKIIDNIQTREDSWKDVLTTINDDTETVTTTISDTDAESDTTEHYTQDESETSEDNEDIIQETETQKVNKGLNELVKEVQEWAKEAENKKITVNYSPITNKPTEWYTPRPVAGQSSTPDTREMNTPDTSVVSPGWPLNKDTSMPDLSLSIPTIPEFPFWDMPQLQMESRISTPTIAEIEQYNSAAAQNTINTENEELWNYIPGKDMAEFNTDTQDTLYNSTNGSNDIHLSEEQEYTLRQLLG
jgi:hypothetical protein